MNFFKYHCETNNFFKYDCEANKEAGRNNVVDRNATHENYYVAARVEYTIEFSSFFPLFYTRSTYLNRRPILHLDSDNQIYLARSELLRDPTS